MRVSPAEYLSLKLRAHELLRGVPLHDVSIVDLPGGGDGVTLAEIRALDSAAPPSRIATILFGVRCALGRLFGWDREQVEAEESLMTRLSEDDRRTSTVTPGTHDSGFMVIYQFAEESLREVRNATVHGFICNALVRKAGGYRLYFAVYVIPVSWITRPYLMLIEPFRRILYPAIFRRIRNAWMARYG